MDEDQLMTWSKSDRRQQYACFHRIPALWSRVRIPSVITPSPSRTWELIMLITVTLQRVLQVADAGSRPSVLTSSRSTVRLIKPQVESRCRLFVVPSRMSCASLLLKVIELLVGQYSGRRCRHTPKQRWLIAASNWDRCPLKVHVQ